MQTLGQRVLLVEDDLHIASFLTPYLKDVGLVVHHAPDLKTAEAYLQEHHGLIILDVMLPDGDGIEFCKKLRKHDNQTPVIILTARDESPDKIAGLDAGADDYVTKPFDVEELVARVRSLLRRANQKPARSYKLQVHNEPHTVVVLDGSTRTVMLGDEEIIFAPKEFDLLWELMDANGRVIHRDELLKKVWGYTYINDTRTVDVHVRGIRRKLGDSSPIGTVWGSGYKVKVPVERLEYL